jgi:hypothetical protein
VTVTVTIIVTANMLFSKQKTPCVTMVTMVTMKCRPFPTMTAGQTAAKPPGMTNPEYLYKGCNHER